ncbi:TetR/AcrR family transcriptional regulator [Frankia sp. AgKG'84/4]|uniref:TetR/AcrR family transcriptional regulator n=1 Tax=Frankia sp. AgKG'84/4 TaxID=573490 RepID=UPI00200D4BA6|nr:TetR/AcrR family transcriptional regulator [Frankia sp. AgKG'84/4]MCL9796198.1 TetR/AcrR family transcriptional regulator [Frankia sp. AgKG'84/4]
MSTLGDSASDSPAAVVASDAVARVVERSMAARVDAATEEVRRLVHATYTVIERTGSTDLSLRAILAAAGCSNQAFYRHFGSKDELLIALLSSGLRRVAADLRDRTAREDNLPARVDAWIRCVLEQATDPATAQQTRPFVAGLGRLQVRFPEELSQSRDLLVDTLTAVLPGADRSREAWATFDLAFGAMQRHVLARTRPDPAEVTGLVRYAQCALGALPDAPG